MARLPTGVAPTPAAERQLGYREALERSGGRRLNLDLEADANTALKTIIERDSEPGAPAMTAKQAVTNALIALAQGKKARR